MTVYALEDGHFVISSNEVWWPGVFASKQAATYAFRFTAEEIDELMQGIPHNEAITFGMLQDKRKQRML